MLANSLVGALDVLLLFFLQAKLPMAHIPNWALGIALFAMQMGGMLGAKLALLCRRLNYYAMFALDFVLLLSYGAYRGVYRYGIRRLFSNDVGRCATSAYEHNYARAVSVGAKGDIDFY